MTPLKKILLLSVGTGAGHVRAAEAISAFAAIHPSGVQAARLDVMDFAGAGFHQLYGGYMKLVSSRPTVYDQLYRMLNQGWRRAIVLKFLRTIERHSCRALLAEVRRQRPDAIVCTHFVPAELLAREIRKGRQVPPVWVLVTDFDLRGRWIVPDMSGYFLASEEVAWRARARGMAADAVFASGIPVMPAFGQPLDRRDCAARFGLDPARKTLLLMAGGAGLGRLDSLAQRLLAIPADFQIVALAGRNQAMLQVLQNLARRHTGRLFAQGFTDQVERLMACADLVITKPGGLTTAECLAMGLPMIVHSQIAGPEESNTYFLLEHGVALKAVDDDAVAYRVEALLQAPERLETMRQKSAALGRPQAARAILDRVLGLAAPTVEVV